MRCDLCSNAVYDLISLTLTAFFLSIPQESRANRTLDSEAAGECDRHYPMSPILKRVIDANHRHHRKCNNTSGFPAGVGGGGGNSNIYGQKSFVDLPQATLDLSGGSGLLCNGKIHASSSAATAHQHNSTAIKSALELSTLV